MRELIERLEKAEAGSRELDCEIGLIVRTDGRGEIVQWGNGEWVIQDAGGPYVVDDYTTSLDAALALAERVLDRPYLWVGSNRGAPHVASWSCEIVDGDDFRAPAIEADAATGPLAICIAILRALRTTEQHSPAQQMKED